MVGPISSNGVDRDHWSAQPHAAHLGLECTLEPARVKRRIGRESHPCRKLMMHSIWAIFVAGAAPAMPPAGPDSIASWRYE
jgi:hypothetical protein